MHALRQRSLRCWRRQHGRVLGDSPRMPRLPRRARLDGKPRDRPMSMTQRYAGMLRRHPFDWDKREMPIQAECCRQAARHMEELQASKDAEIQTLRAALQWYADGLHFDKASPDAWDTVSGEPQNWWCDEAGTATVEDGSIAAMVLRGELTGTQVQALD